MADDNRKTEGNTEVEMSIASEPVRKKVKDRILQLSELRRGLVHQLVAQYGTTENPTYVMQVCVDGVTFQGVGPSKKRAKIMAAEDALCYLGQLDASEIERPLPETGNSDDFTSDSFLSQMYYDFSAGKKQEVGFELTAPVYQDEAVEFEDTLDDEFAAHVGRNAVAILSELHPYAQFWVIFESYNTNRSHFVFGVRVDGQVYRGEAPTKKAAKGRAAAAALHNMYGIEFVTSEDGMPMYEGNTNVWQNHKARLEKEAELQLVSISAKNPVAQLHELFPDTQYDFPETSDKPDSFFLCRVTVAGETHDGVGFNKKDAKSNAATNALEALRASGVLEQKLKERETKRLERVEKQKELENGDSEKAKRKQEKKLGGLKNPVAKLNELFPGVEYQVVGETPLRNTCLTAFVVAVTVDGSSFMGIGKNKKLARLESAEKALRAKGYWTAEDEWAKARLACGDQWGTDPSLASRFSQTGPTRGRPYWAGRGHFAGPRFDAPWRAGGEMCEDFYDTPGMFGQRFRGRGGRFIGQGFDDGGFLGDEYGADEEEPLEGMIHELSFLVASILDSNPNLHAVDVWGMLQANRLYQSWRGGDASGVQPLFGERSRMGNQSESGPYWSRGARGMSMNRRPPQPLFGRGSMRQRPFQPSGLPWWSGAEYSDWDYEVPSASRSRPRMQKSMFGTAGRGFRH